MTSTTQMMDDFRLNYEETKLCLGLPGGKNGNEGSDSAAKNNNQGGKRGFSETVDLKLNLATSRDQQVDEKEENVASGGGSTDTPAKAQVVGWPPVRSFRKNILSVQKGSNAEIGGQNSAFVKVSVDGAPYLRKVDLKIYKSYQELSQALSKMFSSFTIGDCGANGMKDFMNENKLIDLINGSEYVPTYEDKDGDWMLVGDVPWEYVLLFFPSTIKK
ncbi:hypothetical protein Leryth_001497 [Lithospermum erythrorhizon]|nr:hypothetical protein Leryth_001497 [Lithospermum erythrorhizon]